MAAFLQYLPQPKESHTKLWITILTGVLIAIALIGVAFISYRSKQHAEPSPNQNTAQTTSERMVLDTASPIDRTAVQEEQKNSQKLVDELDDESDFKDDLNDRSLGL